MPRFRFRLAPVSRLREAERDERRAELADAYRVADALRAQVERIDEQSEILRQIEAGSAGALDVDRMLAANRHRAVLHAERRKIEAQQAQVAQETERRREALTLADREVRVLEKLRDARFARHQAEENKVENSRLD